MVQRGQRDRQKVSEHLRNRTFANSCESNRTKERICVSVREAKGLDDAPLEGISASKMYLRIIVIYEQELIVMKSGCLLFR